MGIVVYFPAVAPPDAYARRGNDDSVPPPNSPEENNNDIDAVDVVVIDDRRSLLPMSIASSSSSVDDGIDIDIVVDARGRIAICHPASSSSRDDSGWTRHRRIAAFVVAVGAAVVAAVDVIEKPWTASRMPDVPSPIEAMANAATTAYARANILWTGNPEVIES